MKIYRQEFRGVRKGYGSGFKGSWGRAFRNTPSVKNGGKKDIGSPEGSRKGGTSERSVRHAARSG